MHVARIRLAAGRAVVALAVVGLTGGCTAASTSTATGVLTVDGAPTSIEVVDCAADGRIDVQPPEGRTLTLLVATGVTATNAEVEVTVRRSVGAAAPHRVETIEVSIGDPAVSIEALSLVHAYDADVDRWWAIDPSLADPRVEVSGPLLDIDAGSVRASGTAYRPGDGTPVTVEVAATCPATDERAPLAAIRSA